MKNENEWNDDVCKRRNASNKAKRAAVSRWYGSGSVEWAHQGTCSTPITKTKIKYVKGAV